MFKYRPYFQGRYYTVSYDPNLASSLSMALLSNAISENLEMHSV